MKFLLGLALSLFASLCVAGDASYPIKPITLVVPYAAGGPMDKLARELVEPLRVELGQPIIIQNVAGAGGNLGTAQVKRSPNDGYTLLMNHIGMATAPAMYKDLTFDPERDFDTLGVFADMPLVLVTRPEAPTNSLVDFVRWAAHRQPSVTLANAGMGSASHLCGLMLQESLSVQMATIPYKGTGPAIMDLIGGHVDMLCDLTANAAPHIQSGTLKAIGVTSPSRLIGTSLDSVPTLREFGINNVQLSIWYGLYSPKGTPLVIRSKINTAVQRIVNTQAFQQQQIASGVRVANDHRSTLDGHKDHLARQIMFWGRVIRTASLEFKQ